MSLEACPLIIREAVDSDFDSLTSLYAWHVIHGCGSFEEVPPDHTEMIARWRKVCHEGLPWLVAEYAGRLVGYCYATRYRPRPAYRFTVEDSVYIDAEMGGKGIGTQLMQALIIDCEQRGFRQMLAIVGDGKHNVGSRQLHSKMGFDVVGNFRDVGFKKGEWRDTLLMQRALTPPSRTEGGE